MTAHVTLLGDSIFDNGSYTRGDPDVASHLRALLPHSSVTLCAVDGARISAIPEQLSRAPRGTTHFVVSVGGNDVLGSLDLLDRPACSSAEVLAVLNQRAAVFEARYRDAVEEVRRYGRPLALCTIYNGHLNPKQAPLARTALTAFNDVITRVAFEAGDGLIDLRSICTHATDYANSIEPSGVGGAKIARAIATWLEHGYESSRQSVVVSGAS